MTRPKSANVILERPLVLKVGTTKAKPTLAAVFLVGAPVTFDGQRLAALAAGEGLVAVLTLVVSLEGAEVFQRFGCWVVDVVFAPFFAAIAWHT